MTITMCYLSPEGVIFGTDSVSSTTLPHGGFHHLANAQKLFQVGQNATLGIATWGLAALPGVSYRTLVARLADDLAIRPAATVLEASDRWIDLVWAPYSTELRLSIDQARSLAARTARNETTIGLTPTAPQGSDLADLRFKFSLGFCLGGYLLPDRAPAAYHMTFDLLAGKPRPQALGMETVGYWGATGVIDRILHGADPKLKADLVASGKWRGTEAELDRILGQHALALSSLPLRDAVDFVHSCVLSTIKGVKFSSEPQVCGGPIELATIRTDGPFQWVRHKPWDAALGDGHPDRYGLSQSA